MEDNRLADSPIVDVVTTPPAPLWKRPIPSAFGLFLVYVALSFTMSTGGYLGTDTGAKVATLDVMEQRGTARPVLGYWAEDLDPEGELHPIFGTSAIDGDWVHVTTLPMLQLARPLWAVGGYRATLLLPMLGAIGAAFSARSLGQRSGGNAAGWDAFWAVGLASPMLVYALDFWEHAPGVACMVGAVALLAGIVDDEPVRWRALGAGLLLGVASTMRTESFVYAVVAVAGCSLIVLARHRSFYRSAQVGLLAVAGFAPPWVANQLLERALGGRSRGDRLSGSASSGFDQVDERVREAVVTLLAMRPGSIREVVLLGGLSVLLVGGAIGLGHRQPRVAVALLAGAAALHVLAIFDGLAFVPGLFAAAPMALAALILRPAVDGARYALAVGLAALPLVWGFQYLGGAAPQWAGRYALASCILLVALGVVALRRAAPSVRAGVLALSILVTLSGVAWLHERSHSFERLFDQLVDRPEDVILARNGFFVREGGDAYDERRWLNALSDDDLERAFALVGEAGLDSLAILDEAKSSPEQLHGALLVETVETSVVGVRLYLHSYQL